ncbi:MAG: oligosaccharide flippase family protein [Pontiella sp.]
MQITKKLIITNTLWSAVAQVLVMGINLLVLPLFIKNLGAELFGIWVISNVVLGYLSVFDFGFTQGLQKYVAEARVKGDDKELSEVVVSGVGLLLIIGLLLGGIFWIGASSIVEFFNIQPENQRIATQLLKISALFCIVMWPLRIVDVVLNASMRIKELGFLNAFKTGAQSIVMLGMVYYAADIVSIKWVTTGLMAVCSAYGMVVVKKYVPEICWRPNYFKFQQIKRMHKFSLGMFYLAVLGMLSVRIDNLVIGKLLGMNMVAVYAIIAKPYELINRIGNMMMQTLMPATFNLLPSSTREQKEKLVCLGVKYRTLILVPMTVVSIYAIPSFLRLWVGEEYLQYAIWAQLFSAVHLFMGLASLGNIARADGAMRLVNCMLTVKVFSNVAMSILLTLRLGVGGVIMGTFISNIFFGEVLFGGWISKKMGIRFGLVLRNFFPVLIVGVICLLPLLFIKYSANSWLSLMMFSSIFYLVLVAVIIVMFLREQVLKLLYRGGVL